MQAQISLQAPAFQRKAPTRAPSRGGFADLYGQVGLVAKNWLARRRAAQAYHRTVVSMAGLSEQMLKDASVSEELRADVRSYQAMLGARSLRELGSMTRR